jgi:hypothetical protein
LLTVHRPEKSNALSGAVITRKSACHRQKAIRQRTLAVVDLRDDREISNELAIHVVEAWQNSN